MISSPTNGKWNLYGAMRFFCAVHLTIVGAFIKRPQVDNEICAVQYGVSMPFIFRSVGERLGAPVTDER